MKQLIKNLWKWLANADDWLIHRSLRIPRLQETEWLEKDARTLARVLPWLVRLVILAICLLIVGWLVYWLFWIGPKTRLSESKYQQVPTAIPQLTPRDVSNFWTRQTFLTQSEALALREQENAVNLVYIKKDGVSYTTLGVVFDPKSWTQATTLQVPRVSGLSVSGTGVQMTQNSNGSTLALNVYQPFVFAERPDYVFLVDQTGQMWITNFQEESLKPVDQVKDSLPVKINPNPELSPSY